MDDQQQSTPPPPAAPYVQPPMGSITGPTADEKTQSMLCWILSIFAGFIPGLIFYLVANDKPYLKRQGAMALTVSIMGLVGMIASAILMIILIGIVTYIATAIWVLVVCIMGAIACNKGENYSPKFASDFCFKLFKL